MFHRYINLFLTYYILICYKYDTLCFSETLKLKARIYNAGGVYPDHSLLVRRVEADEFITIY